MSFRGWMGKDVRHPEESREKKDRLRDEIAQQIAKYEAAKASKSNRGDDDDSRRKS